MKNAEIKTGSSTAKPVFNSSFCLGFDRLVPSFKAGSKLTKAQELGVKILDEAEFVKMFQ
jgi:NAD-dependent DNA ligase